MDKFKKYTEDQTAYSFFWILMTNLFAIGSYLLFKNVFDFGTVLSLGATIVIAFTASIVIAKLLVMATTEPLKAIWQAVWHVSPGGTDMPAPKVDALTHGRELAAAVVKEIYDNAGGRAEPTPIAVPVAVDAPAPLTPQLPLATGPSVSMLDHIPLPIIALDKDDKIVETNKATRDYLVLPPEELTGKSVYDVMHLSFAGSDTLEKWLTESKQNIVTGSSSWDRVRMLLPDDKGQKQFDLMAHYTKDEPTNHETLLAIFDHTEKYDNEDNSTSYVAMAVHELRTPLTLLRGYIEVFEDELDSKLTPELRDFMHKMSASAQTLTAFVSNILNVARVDENALTLSLHEANWNELLAQICSDLELRARVRGKSIELDITPNLPSVAVDKVSIYEVMSNLIDNAIKYSADSSKIVIHSNVGKDGTIETTVQDFGLGIPEGALKHLFTKFYRSHRSKGKVSGSGLGLYLVKAIVSAHGGQVWVNSKEGEGSTFGFTIVPYSSVAAEIKDAPGGNIDREAHGWIKNHSMYRR